MFKRITGFFKSSFSDQVFIRSIYAESLLENFFVAAVAALFGMRLFLSLSGYPTLGGQSLHIAHMLFGGMFMLIALIIMLGFLNHAAHEMAAVVGGAGFGLFIDELGKFITNDNDYFYRPSIAVIYVIFVIIYLVIRVINRRRALSPEEALANAFEIAKQAGLGSMDARDQQLIHLLLDFSDPKDLLTQNLKDMLPRISAVAARRPHLTTRVKNALDNFYAVITKKWWFTTSVVGFFVVSSVFTFYSDIALIQWSWVLIIWVLIGLLILFILSRSRNSDIVFIQYVVSMGIIAVGIFLAWVILANLKERPATFSDFAQLLSSSASAIFVLVGIARMPRFRLGAYYMFRRAVLVSILLTRVFTFYEYQFFALVGLSVDIVVLFTLRYMTQQEQLKVWQSVNARPGAPQA